MQVNLFEKKELWITNIFLNGTDLSALAAAVADVLHLKRENVLVVDVRESHITLDVLEDDVQAEFLFGKKDELLKALQNLNGVTLTPETDVHSNGILGAISMEKWAVKATLEKSQAFSREMAERIRKKAKVFPTGFEVKKGMIKDTNTDFIITSLAQEGYKAVRGEILDDDADAIAGAINRAVDEGFGLIVTTGGVGAESKDRTVEGILKVDPDAAAPYLVTFEAGKGRHEKCGVRIAVGRVEYSLIVALPGPNDEVRASVPVMLEGLRNGAGKEVLGNSIADVLRDKYRRKCHHHHH